MYSRITLKAITLSKNENIKNSIYFQKLVQGIASFIILL